MSMTNDRGKPVAIPQPGIRTRRGRLAFPIPRGLDNEPYFEQIKPRANKHSGRKRHGIARALESLRGMRLPLVSRPS